MIKALFRVDAGPGIGAGHMMRCLALAEAWCVRGGSVTLLTTELSQLPAGWAALGAEICGGVATGLGDAVDLTMTRDLALEINADWVVVDGYHFSESWLDALGQSRRLLYLNDLGECDAAAALVLNQNPGAETRYRDAYSRCQRSLLGLDWFLLGSAWCEIDHSPEPGRLLLTLGGSSSVDLILALMRALLAIGGSFFADVVVTAPSAETSALIDIASRHPDRFNIHQGPLFLPPLMARAAVVICGGGVTPVEALSLGAVPVILTLAENQVPGARQLATANVARVSVADFDGIVATARMAQDLLDDEPSRCAMAASGRRMVDGKGAQRVVQVMIGEGL